MAAHKVTPVETRTVLHYHEGFGAPPTVEQLPLVNNTGSLDLLGRNEATEIVRVVNKGGIKQYKEVVNERRIPIGEIRQLLAEAEPKLDFSKHARDRDLLMMALLYSVVMDEYAKAGVPAPQKVRRRYAAALELDRGLFEREGFIMAKRVTTAGEGTPAVVAHKPQRAPAKAAPAVRDDDVAHKLAGCKTPQAMFKLANDHPNINKDALNRIHAQISTLHPGLFRMRIGNMLRGAAARAERAAAKPPKAAKKVKATKKPKSKKVK